MTGAVDLYVSTNASVEEMDSIVQSLGAAVAAPSDDAQHRDAVVVRCYGGCEGFIRFAITNQGYGTVIDEKRV